MSEDGTRAEQLERLAAMNRGFAQAVPHNRALGIEILDLDEGKARFRLPYREDLVGNPETGVLHGGVISTLMDACCGAAVFMALGKPVSIATLDLRIDYLRPATPRLAVTAEAECYRVTRNVAFVRGVAFHGDSGTETIASAAGSFMLGTKSGRRSSGGRAK